MNDDRQYRRVWLRREVLPRLVAGSRRDIVEVLARQADLIRDDDAALDDAAREAVSIDETLDVSQLLAAGPARAGGRCACGSVVAPCLPITSRQCSRSLMVSITRPSSRTGSASNTPADACTASSTARVRTTCTTWHWCFPGHAVRMLRHRRVDRARGAGRLARRPPHRGARRRPRRWRRARAATATG